MISKKMQYEMKKVQGTILAFINNIKNKYKLDDLNHGGNNIMDLFYKF
jgi:hypothetical protein